MKLSAEVVLLCGKYISVYLKGLTAFLKKFVSFIVPKSKK
uniref:Uncharacterized protein n=1 Tax=Anguilla anguilla TaxID=7936 RepID=A0A0E9WDJ9_ANGAN